MSRNDYRPLNVRDALSYLDKVKVSLRISSFSLGPPAGERDVQVLAAMPTWIENRGSRFETMRLLCLF